MWGPFLRDLDLVLTFLSLALLLDEQTCFPFLVLSHMVSLKDNVSAWGQYVIPRAAY